MRYTPKKFTIIVPEAWWPLACLIVTSRGPEGMGMFCVKLIDDKGVVYYSCCAGGWLDDADTYETFRNPWALWEYLQTFSNDPLQFDPEDVVNVFSVATVIDHDDDEVVTDAVFETFGLSIIGIVQPPG